MIQAVELPRLIARRPWFRRWPRRADVVETPLCQFEGCDEDAVSRDAWQPLCSLHRSLIEELEVPSHSVVPAWMIREARIRLADHRL